MTPIKIESLDDPRVAMFADLKDRDLARQGGCFIAEGEFVVRRLLASHYITHSLLLSERRVTEIGPLVPPGVPIYVASPELMHGIVGFKFHSGVLACGIRGERKTLDEILLPPDSERLTIVICPEIGNAENLGGIVRIAAGFGADALLLGERCADPFFRQCVRVSMGTVFRLPLVQSDDLMRDLKLLRERWNVQLLATVLADDAEPLARARRSSRMGILFGAEAHGLSEDVVAACDRRITIPMQLGTDSLNVAVAAAVVLYHFTNE